MIIDCIADLHGEEPELEGGDLLIIAGDVTASDTPKQYERFCSWLSLQDHYRKKIVIAGNHDNGMVKIKPQRGLDPVNPNYEWFEYLCDSGTEFEGLKIWGTPWSLWFHGVNPHCKAFMSSESELQKKYAIIPDDIDILISHTPMKHMLDQDRSGYHCGSASLRDAVDKIKPKLFVCGHIHENGGQMLLYKHQGLNTICVNASIMDENYDAMNKPVRIEI